MRFPDPNDPVILAIGATCSAILLIAIVVAHTSPIPAPRMGLRTVDEGGIVLHVPAESPCTVDRVRLACDRWARYGWPQCYAQPTGGEVEVVVYEGEAKGAASQNRIGIRPDSCGVKDPTIEHEIGHLLYDLAHVSLTGTVMCYHDPAPEIEGFDLERPDCAGLRFPVAP